METFHETHIPGQDLMPDASLPTPLRSQYLMMRPDAHGRIRFSAQRIHLRPSAGSIQSLASALFLTL
ncbi:hypothetical protein BK658_26675 [Pseudomonas brassicacearum]|uniref:Uncharacterized protein n=1 Tax=Pseudomonas brassicacearum TaxID=930166 RepID=A0A423GJD9_9PSED|nr:hypothetical protein BK658_26675 [Pseudomonas brassicacearum]